MENLDGFVTATRRIVVLVCLSTLIGASLLYVFSYRNSRDRDFFQLLLPRARPNYHFYTGPRGGRFEAVGAFLSNKDDEGRFHDFAIKREPSSGSPENARVVATTGNAFALVEERALRANDWLAQRTVRIAPLHMEKLQIVYSKKRWASALAAVSGVSKDTAPALLARGPRLAAEMDDASKAFFHHAIVYAGPTGSGTRLMTSYVLDAAGVQPESTISGNFDDIVRALGNGDAHVAFAFAAPLTAVADALKQDKDIGLVGLDPNLGPLLLQRAGVAVEPTSLDELGHAETDTLGAYAWLVASADVPPEHIAAVVRALKEFHPAPSELGQQTSPDTLENIAASFQSQAEEHERGLWFALGEFALKTLGLSILLYYWLGSALSALLRARIMRDYMRLREAVGCSNDGSADACQRIEETCARIDALLQRIHKHCASGLLLIRHRDQLTALLEGLEKRLMRICRSYVRNLAKTPGGAERAWEIAARWHSRDYIDGDEYERLARLATAAVT